MPIRVCAHPNCPNPATYRGRCPTHARQHDRTIPRAGYTIYRTRRWRTTRQQYLHRHPLCQRCGRIATDVHHQTDLADGGNPWDPAGLEALCRSCHSQITRHHQTQACRTS